MATKGVAVRCWVFVALCFAACSSRPGAADVGRVSSSSSSSDSALNALAVTAVQTVLCQEKPFPPDIKCEGVMKAAREQVWTAETAGVVQSFSGVNGRRYAAGETIAVLDGAALALKLQRSILTKYAAEQEYKSLLLGYGGLLVGKSGGLVDSIERKLRFTSGLALAEQDIKETEALLNKMSLRAGFNGVIADVKVSEGSYVNAGEVLFRLYADQDLRMETEVLETDLSLISKGMEAKVFALSDTSNGLKAVVDNINPYVNAQGMVRIALRVVDPRLSKLSLFPGLHGYALIAVGKAKAPVVPSTALVLRHGEYVVFTVLNGEAQWKKVTIGRETATEVEILSGLRVGDRVIVSNNAQLSQNSPVRE